MGTEELYDLLPPQLRCVRIHESEIESKMAFLFGPGNFPSEEELEEVVRCFQARGYVLLWSTVLQDKVAYVKAEAEKAKVPKGFIIYTDEELRHLFDPDAPAIERRTLRVIHEAKKQGAVVDSREWKGQAPHVTDGGGSHDQKGRKSRREE